MKIDNNILLKKLNDENIFFKIFKHKPLYTVDDSIKNRGSISGAHTKNLFLKNKKNKFFLFSCLETTKIDLKKISQSLGLGNISFANENYLYEYLGVLPGSVTPFGLLNDLNNNVKFYFDSEFLKEESVNFHPLKNTMTLNLSAKDLVNFLIKNKKDVNIFNFSNYSIIE